jgi:transketolase
VQHCVAAAETLAAEGISARVVSFPSWELFELQDSAYQESVLGVEAPRLSIEAGSTFGWAQWADDSIGIDHFGASAPGPTLMEQFGITADHVVERARALVAEA